jgi:hypothetical protein
MILTQTKLKELLDYDPETGTFIWKVNRGGRFRAGKEAGWPNELGYRIITIGRKTYRGSHLAWLAVHGRLPAEEMDHINGEPTDDRISNLRPATSSQNKWNTRIQKNHSGALKGAYFHKPTGKWRAQIMKYRKLHYLGLFDTPEEAHAAYDRKARELFGEFARAR